MAYFYIRFTVCFFSVYLLKLMVWLQLFSANRSFLLELRTTHGIYSAPAAHTGEPGPGGGQGRAVPLRAAG